MSLRDNDTCREFLREFWAGSGKTIYSAYTHEYQYRQLDDLEEMTDTAVLNLMSGSDLPGANIERLTIDFGTISTASYWGGRIYRPEGGCVWIDPVIKTTDDLAKVTAMPPETGDLLKAVDLYNGVVGKLDCGSLPCTFFDIQGPLNTLSLIWEQQNLMMTMIDSPDEVHKALDMVTVQLIRIIKTFLRLLPDTEAPLWPYIWLPPDIGIGITEDYMPLLSPELYKEFGIPYLKRISDEFKGLFIHCCGQFTHQIDNLVNSDINILGMEFVYPNIDIEYLFRKFSGTAVFVPNIMDNCIHEFGNITEYYKYIHKIRREDTRLWFLLRPDLDDFDYQAEFMEQISDVL